MSRLKLGALQALIVALVLAVMLAVVPVGAHVSGHVYSAPTVLPTLDDLCGLGLGKIDKYRNVLSGNDYWVRKYEVVDGNWVLQIYASKADANYTDLVPVKTYTSIFGSSDC